MTTAGNARRLGPLDAAGRMAAAYDAGDPVALATLVRAPGGSAARPGDRLVVSATGAHAGTFGDAALDTSAATLCARLLADRGTALTHVIETAAGAATVYVEAQYPPPELLIVGAGHIAVPLAQLGVLLGYRVTVLDDREDFATADRFPAAAQVRQVDFAAPFRDVPVRPQTHVVLVTRAHRYDFDCLSELLRADAAPAYIGMIGSRRRVRAAFHALLEAGTARERLATVHAPVGLDIGAETPAEIAVSIAAELVALRRGAGPQITTLSNHENVLQRLLPEAGK